MILSFTIKSLGKRRPILDRAKISLDTLNISTVNKLLEKLAVQQVKEFNLRKKNSNLINLLNEKRMSETTETGSIKFNEQYNKTLANEEKAIAAVLQAFEDGVVALFINETRMESLNEKILLNESDSLTIIKLTFLAGSIW